jgi:hypothetical protein
MRHPVTEREIIMQVSLRMPIPLLSVVAGAVMLLSATVTSAQETPSSIQQAVTISTKVRNWSENGNVVPVCWENRRVRPRESDRQRGH